MTYKLNHHEYVKIVRCCAEIAKYHESEAIKDMVLELLSVHYDRAECYFEVSRDLMQRVAIINMCNMSLIQMQDSCGEIDYANLGYYSKSVLHSILNNINDI